MKAALYKFVRDLFTEADNETWDLGRVQGTVAFAAYLVALLIATAQGKFEAQAAGIGLAAVMAGYGGMIFLKGKEASSAEKPK